MVGIIVFFLTFLIAGINFLSERTSGTLEKLLSTPIRRGEIIAGYTLGFGILAVIQSLVVTLFVVYVLGMIRPGLMPVPKMETPFALAISSNFLASSGSLAMG